jgi:nucleoside-diphosphate-sugar epimerase
MKIAILGATSQIANDLISSFLKDSEDKILYLFTRRPDELKVLLGAKNINKKYFVIDYSSFTREGYDAIINFVGVGDPMTTLEMGSLIFNITLQYDQMALDYLNFHPNCRYIFLSSGAVYGDIFIEPANENTRASIAINDLQFCNWYSIAKLHTEARHRALRDFSITDIRVFNYFSHTQDMSARFLITDIIRAIRNKKPLEVSQQNIFRDYIGPRDFCQLITLILEAPKSNISIDCYSNAPIDKISLLEAMHKNFGLVYSFSASEGVNATGEKTNYYSTNFKARRFGYAPKNTSLENIIFEARLALTSG